MTPQTIIFIGPQGSGKGTQIELVEKALAEKDPARRIVNIQTGRRFRALAAKGETFADKKIAEGINSGALQPDFITHLLWGQAMLDQLDPKSHLLIDGFPRTAHQARVLDNALDFFERIHLDVVNLDTPDDIVRERMHSRGRSDDTEEAIETRLQTYHQETELVLDHYQDRPATTIHTIDGTMDIDGVHAAVMAALNVK